VNTDEDEPGDSSRQKFYRICVEGHLKSHWSDWFGGLTVTPEESGNTTLSGPVQDQAALFGLLAKVRDLGLTLVSVARVGDERETLS
jgi:hypothetical protein